MNKFAIALVLGAVFAVGCGDKAADGAKSGAAASGSAKADAKTGTGMAECDDYLKKLEACVAKGGPAKDAMEASLKTARDAYKSVPDAAKDTTKASCKTAADALKCD